MMIISINKVATISSGYTFRDKITEKPSSGIRILQIKDIRETDRVIPQNLVEIDWQGKADIPSLNPDEIVIAARGGNNNAALMTQKACVVASNQLLILTIKSQYVLPEYLCWFLNRVQTQVKLTEIHVGTSIPSLSKKALGELAIPLPSIQKQHQIIKLVRLHQQEKSVYNALLKNRVKMLEGTYQQLLNGDQK